MPAEGNSPPRKDPVYLYQRLSFLTDMRPFAPPNEYHGSGLIDEAVPRVSGGIVDVVVGVEDAV
jgi:hypothetical protein